MDGDGLDDLICHFGAQEAGFASGDTEGALTGSDVDGAGLEGSDSVRIAPPMKLRHTK